MPLNTNAVNGIIPGRARSEEEEERLRKVRSAVQSLSGTDSDLTVKMPGSSGRTRSGSDIKLTVSLPTPTSTSDIGTKSALQRLLARPDGQTGEKWYKGEQPTNSEIQARIYTISQSDPQRGRAMWDQYQQFRQDPTSPIYNFYENPTNKAIGELQKLGIDVSGGVTPKWIAEHRGLLAGARYTTTGSAPAAPTTKSTPEENAAYWYYQILKAEDKTEQAETEWTALQEEIAYWTGRKDMNLSDDEILARIDWDRYKTLTGMDDDAKVGVPTTFNRAIGYSQDMLRGLIWAARNGGNPNDPYNSVRYHLGQGNAYVEDPEITRRLNAASEDYNPFMVVATLFDAAAYFGVSSFGKTWTADHMYMRNSTDETERKMFGKVAAAEETTLKAEEELAELRERIETRLKYSSKPEAVLYELFKDLPTLSKLDDSLKGSGLVATTRPVPYSRKEIEAEVLRRCEEANSAVQGQDFVDGVTGTLNPGKAGSQGEAGGAAPNATPKPGQGKAGETAKPGTTPKPGSQGETGEASPEPTKKPGPLDFIGRIFTPGDKAISAQKDSNIEDAAPTVARLGTPDEKVAWETAYSSDFDLYVRQINNAIQSGSLNPQGGYEYTLQRANAFARFHYLNAARVTRPYEEMQQQRDAASEELGLICHRLGIDAPPEAKAIPRKEDLAVQMGQQYNGNCDLTARPKVTADDLRAKGWEVDGEGTATVFSVTYTIQDGKKRQYAIGVTPILSDGTVLSEDELHDYVQWMTDQREWKKADAGRDGKRLLLHAIPVSNGNEEVAIRRMNEAMQTLHEQQWWYYLNDMEVTDADAIVLQERANELTAYIQQANQRLEDDRPDYEKSLAVMRQIDEGYAITERMAALTGASTGDTETARAMLGELYEYTQGFANQVDAYSWMDAMTMSHLMSREQVSEALEGEDGLETKTDMQLAEMTALEAWLEASGIKLPDKERDNLTRRKAYANRTWREIGYWRLQDEPDFADTVKEFREKAKSGIFGVGTDHGEYYPGNLTDLFLSDRDVPEGLEWYLTDAPTKFDNFTREEKDTYLYLYATKGHEAAQEYYDFLTDSSYGRVHSRAYGKEKDAIVRGMGKQEFEKGNPLLEGSATGRTVLFSPMRLSGTFYSVGQFIQGKEVNPTHEAFAGANAMDEIRQVEEASAVEAANKLWCSVTGETLKEGGTTPLGIATSIGYKAVSSGLDSAYSTTLMMPFINAAGLAVGGTAYAAGQAGLKTKAITSAVGASLQGSYTIGATAQETTRRGASLQQVMALSGIAFIAETLTEAIEVNDIMGIHSAGSWRAALLDRKWWKALQLDDAAGEVFASAINNLADDLIMRADSKIEARVEELRSQAIPETEAWKQAATEAVQEMLTEGLIGGLSAGMSSGAHVFIRAVNDMRSHVNPIKVQSGVINNPTIQQNPLDEQRGVTKGGPAVQQNGQQTGPDQTGQQAGPDVSGQEEQPATRRRRRRVAATQPTESQPGQQTQPTEGQTQTQPADEQTQAKPADTDEQPGQQAQPAEGAEQTQTKPAEQPTEQAQQAKPTEQAAPQEQDRRARLEQMRSENEESINGMEEKLGLHSEEEADEMVRAAQEERAREQEWIDSHNISRENHEEYQRHLTALQNAGNKIYAIGRLRQYYTRRANIDLALAALEQHAAEQAAQQAEQQAGQPAEQAQPTAEQPVEQTQPTAEQPAEQPAPPVEQNEQPEEWNFPEYLTRQVAAINNALTTEDVASRTATVAAIIAGDTQDENGLNTATAAAMRFVSEYGEAGIRGLQNLLVSAAEQGVDDNIVRGLVSIATLSDGDSHAYLKTLLENGAPIDGAALDQLSRLVTNDLWSEDILAKISERVKGAKQARATMQQVGDGAMQGLAPQAESARQAQANLDEAESRLESARAAQQAAGDNLTQAAEQFQQNPADPGAMAAFQQATKDAEGAAIVTQQAEQSVAKNRESAQAAQDAYDTAEATQMRKIREQSAQQVEEQDQADAQARAAREQQASRDNAVTGNSGVMLSGDQEIQFHYALVNGDGLIVSHNTALQANEAYPAELQPRNRSTTNDYALLSKRAAKLQPMRLGASPDVQHGAPVVGSDFVVEAGNGRVIALNMARERGLPSAQAYTEYLRQHANEFGFTPGQVTPDSVLVRVRDTDVDRVRFAQQSNEETTQRYTASETARVDASLITPAMLALLNPDADLSSQDNADFISAFLRNVVPENDTGDVTVENGRLSDDGRKRLERALFHLAYGSDILTAAYSEALGEERANIMNALKALAPKFAQMNAQIAEGSRHPLSISSEIAQAVEILRKIQKTNTPLEEYLSQFSMLEAETPPAVAEIARMFDNNRRSGKAIQRYLSDYIATVDSFGDPNQVRLDTMEVPTDKAQFIHDVFANTTRMMERQKGGDQTSFLADEQNNAEWALVDEFIDSHYPGITPEERVHLREVVAPLLDEMYDPGRIQARQHFVERIQQKFGVNIRISDLGEHVNGEWDSRSNTIWFDRATPQTDILYHVALHELTHKAEGSKYYKDFAKALTDIAYRNADGTVDTERMERDIEAKRQAYNETRRKMFGDMAREMTRTEAYHELVADLTKPILYGDENAIRDFVDKSPSAARNFFTRLKNFLKRLIGIDNSTTAQLRRTRDLFERALRTAGQTGAQESETAFYDDGGSRDGVQYSLRVTDPETLSFLDGQETVTTYRSMQLIDGKLYPPMAARVKGQYEDPSVLGAWEMSAEHPELAVPVTDKTGEIVSYKFKLDKGKGQGSIEAAYNPYMHSSNSMLNDQFSGAYTRPNLVTVECEVPVSEITSGYHAEKAKDGTGWHSWHSGTVAGQIRAAKGFERQVFLSRWLKPVRIVPVEEVAQYYADLLSGTDVSVPDNVVSPALLDALREAGVPIEVTGRVTEASRQRYAEYQRAVETGDAETEKVIAEKALADQTAVEEAEQAQPEPDVSYSLRTDDSSQVRSDFSEFLRQRDAEYERAVERKDTETAQRMVDEAAEAEMPDSKIRDEDGKLLAVFHGTGESFTIFDRTRTRSNMDIQGMFFSPWEMDAGGYGENVGRYYLNIRNPAPEGEGYRALRRFQGQNGAGAKAREYLISRGYDGVNNGGEEYIAFYPEQIKLADPATYDDSGELIPLSERFQRDNPDIRHSLRTDDTVQDEFRRFMSDKLGEYGGPLTQSDERAILPDERQARGPAPAAPTRDGPVKSGAQIVRDLVEGLNIPIDSRTKKYLREARKTTSGYTRNGRNIAHINDPNNVGTASHELGHIFSQIFDLKSKAPTTEMVKRLANGSFGWRTAAWIKKYKEADRAEEAIAEFSRIWIRNREAAEQYAGKDFLEYWEGCLRSRGWLAPMQRAAQDLRINLAATSDQRAMASVELEDHRDDTWYQRGLRGIATRYADYTLPLHEITRMRQKKEGITSFEAAQDPRILMLARNGGSIENFFKSCLMGEGMVDPEGNRVLGDDGNPIGSFAEIIGVIPQDQEKEFGTYWELLHTLYRDAADKPVFNEDVRTNDAIKRIEARHPEYRAVVNAAEAWYEKFMRVWVVDTGMLGENGQALFEALRKKYPYYIPTFRTGLDGRSKGKPKRSQQARSGVMTARGSTLPIYNPVMGFAEYMQRYITNYRTVEAFRALADSADLPGMESIMEPAERDMEAVSNEAANDTATKRIVKALAKLHKAGDVTDEAVATLLDVLQSLPDMTFYQLDTASGDDVLSFPGRDGKMQSWTVYDRDFLNALLVSPQSKRSRILQALGALTSFLAGNATGRSLTFSVPNVLSDTETAMITGHAAGNRIVYYAQWLGSAFDHLRNLINEKLGKEVSEDFRNFQLFGAYGSRFSLRNGPTQQEIRRSLYKQRKTLGSVLTSIAKAPVKTLIGTLTAVSGFGEDTTRYNQFRHEYHTLQKRNPGQSKYSQLLLAGKAAHEDSTDFKKRGMDEEVTPVARVVIPFFNGQLQGIYKTARMFSSENAGMRGKIAARLITRGIVFNVAMQILRHMTWRKEEEDAYDLLTDAEKVKYYHVKLPDGTFARVKKSQDAIIQFADMLGETIGRTMTGYEDNPIGALVGFSKEIAQNMLLQFDTILDPFIDPIHNEQWNKRRIEGYDLDDLPEMTKYDDDTPSLYRIISAAANLAGLSYSPEDWEYIVGQYTGGLGVVGMNIIQLAHDGKLDVHRPMESGAEIMDVIRNRFAQRWSVDPVKSNDLASTYSSGKTTLTGIVEAASQGKPIFEFRNDLTQEEVSRGVSEAEAMMKKGGSIYTINSTLKKLWGDYYAALEDESQTKDAREAAAREIRMRINEQYMQANEIMGDYFARYGYHSDVARNIGHFLDTVGVAPKERASELRAYYTLPQTFADDVEEPYMQKAMEVYEATSQESALPHASTTFTASGVERTVMDEYVSDFEEQYKMAYIAALASYEAVWPGLTDEEKLKALKSCNTKANNAAKKWYLSLGI